MALQVRANENLYFRFRSKGVVQLYIRVTDKGQTDNRNLHSKNRAMLLLNV